MSHVEGRLKGLCEYSELNWAFLENSVMLGFLASFTLENRDIRCTIGFATIFEKVNRNNSWKGIFGETMSDSKKLKLSGDSRWLQKVNLKRLGECTFLKFGSERVKIWSPPLSHFPSPSCQQQWAQMTDQSHYCRKAAWRSCPSLLPYWQTHQRQESHWNQAANTKQELHNAVNKATSQKSSKA